MLRDMLFAFIDESYTDDRYWIAAVVTHVDHIGQLSNAITTAAEYASTFGVPLGTEFHGHRIMNGLDGWEPIRRKTRAAGQIYRNAARAIASTPARLYFEGVDISLLNRRYRYPDPPHLVVLRHVLERVNQYALSQGEPVIVICDEVQGSDDHARKLGDYKLIGTPGFRSSRLQSLEQIMFASSEQSPGLQAADLAVYLKRRVDAHAHRDERSKNLAVGLLAEFNPIVKGQRRWDP